MNPFELIDIGVNLTNHRLLSQLEDIIQKAQNAGIIHQIITGTSIESSQQALQLTQSLPGYFSSTAGCHPHDAKDFLPEDVKKLHQLATDPSVVAIGECGLDFNRNYSPPDIQRQVFECQIEIAANVSLPLFMHQRDAHQLFIEILSSNNNNFSTGVIHCFTEGKALLKDYLDLGLYIGITGWLCDERRALDLQEAAKYIPLDRIMVETDSPYLFPRTITPKPKSRTNVPANLPWVVKQLATLLDMKADMIAETTTRNAKAFFNLSC